MNEVQLKGKSAKHASFLMGAATTEEKNEALANISRQLLIDEEMIVTENQKDIEAGRKAGLTAAVLDRILLTKERLKDMSDAVSLLQQLDDPIGEVLETIDKENGLHIEKKRVPLGVIGMIYEARPNVTVDAATLALKTGNAVLLRGSSSAAFSNQALVRSIHTALEESRLPKDAVLLLEDTSRETAKQLFQLKEYLDVLIPRGGKKLIDTVVREATVPVIETGAGNCHLYIDENADPAMAQAIVINAKTQRPSVCNAIETAIIHENWMEQHGEKLFSALEEQGVTLIGDEASGVQPIGDVHWDEEFLGLTLRIKIAEDVQQAINHIQQYGTKHSEGIVTNSQDTANYFMNRVDAAAVYHNASTRFTDGFEFGYGAEVGISTQKLHARGPMGLHALTSSKFFITGNGQVRK